MEVTSKFLKVDENQRRMKFPFGTPKVESCIATVIGDDVKFLERYNGHNLCFELAKPGTVYTTSERSTSGAWVNLVKTNSEWTIQTGIVDEYNQHIKSGIVIFKNTDNVNTFHAYYFIWETDKESISVYERRGCNSPIIECLDIPLLTKLRDNINKFTPSTVKTSEALSYAEASTVLTMFGKQYSSKKKCEQTVLDNVCTTLSRASANTLMLLYSEHKKVLDYLESNSSSFISIRQKVDKYIEKLNKQ